MSDPKDSAAAKTASERLEQTRRALMRHMDQGHAPRDGASSADQLDEPVDEDAYTEPSGQGSRDDEGLAGTWHNLRQTAGAWWQSHPAHLALEVAEPVFEKYARTHPMKVLALSAATGAALVLIRPWRLVSVTGLMVAAVKSTQMSALASAMLRPTASEPMRRHAAERAREEELERWHQAQAAARARDQAH